MLKTDEGTYDYVVATVNEDGIALEYKCSELSVVGSDFIDDPGAVTWSDGDVRKVAANYLGITEGRKQIDVVFE